MRVFNKEKTLELNVYDLEKGYLVDDKLFICHHESKEEIKEVFHYETTAVYPNGGKTVNKVIDIPYQPNIDAYDEYEEIKIYIPYSIEELLEIEKNKLREWREQYFRVIDRACWYDTLTDVEKSQVLIFRSKLLDITRTFEKPTIPDCVSNQIK